jgi:hypothetical protein
VVKYIERAMMTRQELKNQTEKIIENLPEESNWEDLMYRIYVRQKIELGITDGKAGRVRTTEEIRKEFNS